MATLWIERVVSPDLKARLKIARAMKIEQSEGGGSGGSCSGGCDGNPNGLTA